MFGKTSENIEFVLQCLELEKAAVVVKYSVISFEEGSCHCLNFVCVVLQQY